VPDTLKSKRTSDKLAKMSKSDAGYCDPADITLDRNSDFAPTNKGTRLSKFAGVHFDMIKGKWRIDLTVSGVQTFREMFADETEAARHYDQLVLFNAFS